MTVDGTLALNDLVHLRTLCIDTLAPLEPRVRWLASSIIFPPQPVSLVINMMSESGSPEVVQLAAADAGLGQLRSIASVTLILTPQASARGRERDLVDVSTAFSYRMPFSAGRGTLRVLRSS